MVARIAERTQTEDTQHSVGTGRFRLMPRVGEATPYASSYHEFAVQYLVGFGSKSILDLDIQLSAGPRNWALHCIVLHTACWLLQLQAGMRES